MSFDLDVGIDSRAGRRERNEDFAGSARAATDRDAALGLIVAVADGVSSGGGGLEAAQTSVISVLDGYFACPVTWDASVALDRVLQAHNGWLHAQNRRNNEREMATTLTAAVLRGQTWTVAHVGDTRAWLLRDGRLQRLTTDHTRHAADLRSTLTRALGIDERVLVDYYQGELQVGDRLLLTSDGVWSRLNDEALAEVLKSDLTAQQAAERLCAAAFDAGSTDNLSAAVVRVRALPAADLRSEAWRARELPVPQRLRVGDTIDGLTVTQLVADNGVNLVYQVRNPGDRRLYALKTLHPSRATDAAECATLAHEAWIARRLTGAQFVRLCTPHDAQWLYLLYEWHAGTTLERELEAGRRFTLDETLAAARALLAALGRLHRLGIVHRDIKPANLHRGDDGVLRIIDLGVAVSGAEPDATRTLHAGTPAYVEPEQWAGAPPGPHSDLFAAGVTLYRMATGRLPYGEIEPYQTGRYRRDPTPPTRHRPELPIWFEHVLLKAVARDPKQRFETAEEFLLAIERGAARPLTAPAPTPLLARSPSTAVKIGLAVSLLLNVMLAGVLLVLH